MANPELVVCAVGQWTVVASSVTAGRIWIIDTRAEYYQSYRDAGDAPPTDLSDAVRLPIPGAPFEVADPADIYIFCKQVDGTVRFDERDAAGGGVDPVGLKDDQGDPISASNPLTVTSADPLRSTLLSTFTKLSAGETIFFVTKGALNKFRLRPRILNEHAESSREVQGVVTASSIVGQVFRASQDNINGVYLTMESAAGGLVDDFDGYANDSALQAAWVPSSARLNTLDSVIAVSGQSMKMPGTSNGDEWVETLAAPTDFTGYTGSFKFRQTAAFGTLIMALFIGDGINTKSIAIAINEVDAWESFDVPMAALTEDGGGTTDETAITEIGFRTVVKRAGSSAWVDIIYSVPPPGSVDLELWDMGTTPPVSGVDSIDDGTQYTTLGDAASGAPKAAIRLPLGGGKRLYLVEGFIAGVALEIPDNVLLNQGHYYLLTINYVDTEVNVYGPDSTYSIDYYQSGYAFTAPDEATPITAVGPYNDCMFGIFSTADVYIMLSTARADATPGERSEYYSFVEDENMDITDIIATRGFQPGTAGAVDLSLRPPLLPKGGKYELYYDDDFTDQVSKIIFGMQFAYVKQIAYG